MQSSETMEHIGETYFDELKAQSFFRVSNSEQRYFVMHDLIHDLAVSMSWEILSRNYYLSNSVLQSLKQLGCLRVLSLCGYKITHIPALIGGLKLLRYLDFSFTYIEELPDSICDLSNLQRLILSYCEQLRNLPAMTKKSSSPTPS
ncbi:hypothetical protein RDABS01_038073 [Bienertia sinuspersici]